jgi:hypothetical protein
LLQPRYLLYDGSHVVKTGSDTHDLFPILPLPAPGVVIHIHDVFYPFEYPQEWVLDDRRSWNELYLLRALLEGNHDYEILAFNDYLYRVRPEVVAPRLPLALKNNGSSLWLRKTTLTEEKPNGWLNLGSNRRHRPLAYDKFPTRPTHHPVHRSAQMDH